MRTLIAIYLALTSTLAYSQADENIMKCQMSMISIDKGQMVGDPHVVSDALLISDDRQFFAVVDNQIINSPELLEGESSMGTHHAGATYLMRKSTFAVLYENFG